MSMWRRITKLLHLHGAMSITAIADDLIATRQEVEGGIKEALRLGTVRRVDVARYEVTLMGRAWAENIVELRRFRPGGAAWCATWIQPLPRFA